MPFTTGVISGLKKNMQKLISLCISHSESLCDRDYPPNLLDQKLLGNSVGRNGLPCTFCAQIDFLHFWDP